MVPGRYGSPSCTSCLAASVPTWPVMSGTALRNSRLLCHLWVRSGTFPSAALSWANLRGDSWISSRNAFGGAARIWPTIWSACAEASPVTLASMAAVATGLVTLSGLTPTSTVGERGISGLPEESSSGARPGTVVRTASRSPTPRPGTMTAGDHATSQPPPCRRSVKWPWYVQGGPPLPRSIEALK